MNNYGFIRTASAVPAVKVGDVGYNVEEICRIAGEAFQKEVSLIVFPELSLTGHSCGDLFHTSTLVGGAEDGIRTILEFSRGKAMTMIVGAPVPYRSRLYDCAVVIRNGNIAGIVPKTYIPSAETRWFASGGDFLSQDVRNDGAFLRNGKDTVLSGFCGEIRYAGQKCNISPNMLFGIGGYTVAVELGDDLWAPVPPSSLHALQGAQIIANLSADKEILMREKYRKDLLSQHSARTACGYIYASAGFGESSQDYVYAGAASIWECGDALAENERYMTTSSLIVADLDVERLENLRRKSGTFKSIAPDGTDAGTYYRSYNRIGLGEPCETDFEKTLCRYVEPHPFVPSEDLDYRCREILSMQAIALARRLSHINCRTAVLGISGGLDSTLALIVTVMAFDKLGWEHDRIVAVTMPGFGTTSRTKNNAWYLMEALGVTCREISIVPSVTQHFRDIGHDPADHNATYENSQARERTQILMDIANQTNGIVVGTGDLSELALGWATYNGDHMSMYAVNADIPKTLVRSLVKWAAENMFADIRNILLDIVDTPISPELLPANDKGEIQQVTEDLVGPYELHDFFIYHFMRNGYSAEKIFFLAKKAFRHHYDDDTVMKWLRTFIRRFFNQQFKRSCMPDGPKVGTVGLSPRGDWAMPSDAWSTMFSKNI
ncbi:MAG: NAD(+) synthase [Bacteroidales bacterium]|nr:NAD(+) synthase [Bacteroidales bacterium]